MKFTGERFIPNDDVDMQLTYEHTHRYEYITGLVGDKVVLDIASGEGYGSAIIAKTAKQVIGIDIDPETVNHAKLKYSDLENVTFECGSVTDIPLDDNSVDVVVSFETIEHIAEHHQMLSELKRVAKDDGLIIISTPDKKVYTDDSGEINQFHVKELYKDEFSSLLRGYFQNVELYGQRFLTVSSILPLHDQNQIADECSVLGDVEECNSVYIIAVCSQQPIHSETLQKSLYSNSALDLYAKDKATLRWANTVHHELMRSQSDYFRLEAEYLALKESLAADKNNPENDDQQ